MKFCVIVGAGMAGLTAAGLLQEGGWKVVLLDKGRGVGGRMATRRIGESRFDHGAQFIAPPREPQFGEAMRRWELAGWVAPWFDGHFKAVGGMSALAKELAKPFDVRTEVAVARIVPEGSQWRVAQDVTADALLMTAPAEQTLALIGGSIDSVTRTALESIRYQPCFALLVTCAGPVKAAQGDIEWIADNTQKGISSGPAAALTIHATAEFSRRHFDHPKEEVAAILIEAAGLPPDTPWQLHRWKYSRPATPPREGRCLFTRHPAPLAIAGDGLGGPDIEGAFLSGLAAAQRIADL